MSLTFEKVHPYAFSVLVGAIWAVADAQSTNINFPQDDPLLSATLTVSGIFVGFLASTKAILMSITSKVMDQIKQTGYIEELVGYVSSAIWANLLFCLVNMIGFFGLQSVNWYSTAWVVIATASLATFIRVTRVMLKILKLS